MDTPIVGGVTEPVDQGNKTGIFGQFISFLKQTETKQKKHRLVHLSSGTDAYVDYGD